MIKNKTCFHHFVLSLKGHDVGTVYVVVMEDEQYVYLANGKLRKLSNPKKKKKKHIRCFLANKLSEYIPEDVPVTDGRLRSAIRSFVNEVYRDVSSRSREEE